MLMLKPEAPASQLARQRFHAGTTVHFVTYTSYATLGWRVVRGKRV